MHFEKQDYYKSLGEGLSPKINKEFNKGLHPPWAPGYHPCWLPFWLIGYDTL